MFDPINLVYSRDKLKKVYNSLLLLTTELTFKSRLIERHIYVLIIAVWMVKDRPVLIKKCLYMLLIILIIRKIKKSCFNTIVYYV